MSPERTKDDDSASGNQGERPQTRPGRATGGMRETLSGRKKKNCLSWDPLTWLT